MTVLIIFSAISLCLHKTYENDKGTQKIIEYSLICFVFLFSAFRYNIGYDFKNYVVRIYEVPYITRIIHKMEIFSFALMKISNILSNPQIFFFMNSLVTVPLILITLKKYSTDFRYSVWVFLTFPMFFLNSLSIVRNFSAFAIAFYSYRYIKERNFRNYIFLIILASLFHKSAIFSLPIYFFYEVSLNFKKRIMLVVLIILTKPILQVIATLFIPTYSKYITNSSNLTAGRGALIVLTLTLIMSLILEKKLIKIDKNASFYINLLLISQAIYIVYFRYGHFAFRITEYLYIYSLFLLPNLKIYILAVLKEYSKKIYIYKIFNGIFYAAFLIMFIYMLKVGGSAYTPYRFKIYKFFDKSYIIEYFDNVTRFIGGLWF